MNDFLEQVWFDNSLKHYLLVAGAILFVLILKRLISKYLAGLLFKMVNRVWKDVDKKSFTNLLIQPLGFFLVILVTIISLYKLHFPSRINVEIYEYSFAHLLHRSATIILIVSFIWLLLRMLDFIAMILEKRANLTPEQTDNQLVVFFRDFFKVIIVIAGVMLVLKYVFDVNVGSLITGLSIIGAATALALRESLENFIASFIIFFDKPFTTGDLVKVNQITGTVERIGLRSTRIRSDQKTYVSVPNKQMVDSVLDNLSLRTQRRADIRLEIALQTESAKVETVIEEIKNLLKKPEIEEYNIVFSEITQLAIVIAGDYYTAPVTFKEYNAIRENTNLQILKILEANKVKIAGTLLRN